MFKTAAIHRLVTALLIALLLTQPIFTSPILNQFLSQPTAYAAPLPRAKQIFSIFLPLIYKPPQPSPPQFVINSPIANSTISGMNFFSVQTIGGGTIENVVFQSGYTEFVTVASVPPQSAIIDEAGGTLASEIGSVISLLPGAVSAGTTVTVDELTQEETTELHGIEWEDMGVTFLGAQAVESDMPLAQPLGMIASAGFGNRVQPGQAVVNYQLMPDSDGDGVAEVVVVNTASVAPNGDVVSDPVEQAVVDSVAVISNQGRRVYAAQNRLQQDQTQEQMSGVPGSFIEMSVQGFNRFSLAGNVALFRSLVDDTEIRFVGQVRPDPADITKQLFEVVIPYPLPVGPATVTLTNLSSGMTTDPITMTVQALPALAQPADQVFAETFSHLESLTAQLQEIVQQDEEVRALLGHYIDQLPSELTAAQEGMAQLFTALENQPVSEVQRLLDDAAKMIEISGMLAEGAAVQSSRVHDDCEPPEVSAEDMARRLLKAMDNIMGWGGGGFATSIGVSFENPGGVTPLSAVQEFAAESPGLIGEIAGPFDAVMDALDTFGSLMAIFEPAVQGMKYVSDVVSGKCRDEPEPRPNRPNPPIPSPPRRRGPTTGMGSAAPPGGNGFGYSAGRGGSRQARTGQQEELARTAIKVLVNNQATPFTGLSDAGGYFFVPFIPAGEPFTAVAVDRVTGETRTMDGTGPALGQSAFLFFDFFTPQQVDYTIQWDGGGDGMSWHDPQNWSLDRIPDVGDRVAITTADTSVVVHDVEETTGVLSLFSTVPISWSQGSLTVLAASTIDNSFQMAGDTSLVVSGLGASFTVNGNATLNGASLFAFDGGQIRMRQDGLYDGDASSGEPEIVADGINSLVDLSGVTQMSGNTKRCCFGFGLRYLKIDATNGGQINLSGVGTIETGRIRLVLDGAENRIDFSGLRQLGNGSELTVLNQGDLRLGQLQRFNGSTLVVDNTDLSLASLTDADASAFTVRNGSQVVLPKLTAYTGTGNAAGTEWTVRGQGSLLDLSATTAITGNTFVNATLSIEVSEGGRFDLSNVETISAGNILFQACQPCPG